MARAWIDKHGIRREMTPDRIRTQDQMVGGLVLHFAPLAFFPRNEIRPEFLYKAAADVENLDEFDVLRVLNNAFWTWSANKGWRTVGWRDVTPATRMEFLRDHIKWKLQVFRDHYEMIYEDDMRRAVRALARAYFRRMRKLYRKTRGDILLEL